MALTPKYHHQDTEPVDAAVLDHWVKLNGEDRILTPSGWIILGNLFSEYSGCIPRKGGVATGAISGAHGHADAHNPRLTGDAKLEDDNLVTTTMLDEALAGVRDLLSGTGSGGTTSVPGTSGGGKVGYEYAFGVDMLFVPWVEWKEFPMPRFSDGTLAKPEQCILTPGGPRAWMFSLVGKYNGDNILNHWPDDGNHINWAIMNRYNGFSIQPHETEYKCRVTACIDDRKDTGHDRLAKGLVVMGLCIARR